MSLNELALHLIYKTEQISSVQNRGFFFLNETWTQMINKIW